MNEYVISSQSSNPHRTCRDQVPKKKYIYILYKTVYMYTIPMNMRSKPENVECHNHNGVPPGLGIGLPDTWACSFLRARSNPSILRRSSCSAWEVLVSTK